MNQSIYKMIYFLSEVYIPKYVIILFFLLRVVIKDAECQCQQQNIQIPNQLNGQVEEGPLKHKIINHTFLYFDFYPLII